MRKLIIAMAVILAAGPVLATCPHTTGLWSTNHPIIGDYPLLGGRVSEAWCGGYPGQPGNMEDAQSWDGATLMNQWHVWGMTIDATGAVETGRDVNEFGNGWIDYTTNYVGGQFWLSGLHSWGNGVDLTGFLTYFNVNTRVTLVGGQIVGATSNVFFTGEFDGCPEANGCVIQYTIANALLVWHPSWGTAMPANYPGFLCSAPTGELFDACCINTSIQCVVDDPPVTWGSVKSLYR